MSKKRERFFFWHGRMWSEYVTNERELEVFRAGMREQRYLTECWLLLGSILLAGVYFS